MGAQGKLSFTAQSWALLQGGVQSYIDACKSTIWFVGDINILNINSHHQNYINNQYYSYAIDPTP